MTDTAREAFLRRYATSPIHVPRLERLLAVYASDGQAEAFCSRFIEMDRACPDGEAARIVAEILSAVVGPGQTTCLGDDAVRGAIRWMSDVTTLSVAERAQLLRESLSPERGSMVEEFKRFLAAAASLEASSFAAAAELMVQRLAGDRSA
jgi:hypothetical protein